MTFLLAHLSDAHIGPLPQPHWRELIGKRLTGYANWRRGRARAHDMGVLGALVADMRAQRPDHVAMTGDVCNLGLPGEFQLAAQWMRTLGKTQDVSLAPGNHDAYVRGALPHLKSVLSPWTCGDDGRPGFPFLRLRDKVALIGLSTAVPTLPFFASGRLGAEQCEKLEELLLATAAQDCFRVVMLHHPPGRGRGSSTRGLIDAKRFGEALQHAGAELILHGHNHSSARSFLPGPGGPIAVIGVASASSMSRRPARRASYHLIAIDAAAKSFSLKTRRLSENGGFVDAPFEA